MKIYIITIFIIFYITLTGQEINYISHVPNAINSDDFVEILTIGEDGTGNIYAAGDSKIYKYASGEWTTLSIPHSSNKIQEIAGDNNGNLFVAVQNEGLWIFKNNTWKLFDNTNSVYPDSVQHGGIAWDKNSKVLWIGTQKGLIKYQNDSLSIYNHLTHQQMVDDDIKDLVLDPDGSVWMISHISTLVHLKDENITSESVGWNLGLYNLIFDHISIKSDGHLVIASSNYGLIEYESNEFKFIGPSDNNLFLVTGDLTGNIWAANKNTLYQYQQETIISHEDSYIPLFINNIFVSSDNHLWIAGENDPITEILQEKPNSVISSDIKEEILIYPIPVSKGKNLTIKVENPQLLGALTIFNLKKQKIFKSIRHENLNINLDKDIYFLSIIYNNKRYIKKIIVN